MVVGERPGAAISFELWRPTSSSMSFACAQWIETRLPSSQYGQRESFRTQDGPNLAQEVDRGFGRPTCPLDCNDDGG